MATKSIAYVIMGQDRLSPVMRKAGDTAEKESGRIHGAFSGAMSKATATIGLLSKAAVGLGAAMGAAAVKGAVYNASLEQAQIGFTTMLGSAKEAKTFLGQLQQFAIKTPFNFPDLVTASQRMIAFGFSAKDVLPSLRAIGDAAAGLGIGAGGVEQITTAIGQMQAKTRVQSDEILQLTEAGVPALRILANEYHVSTMAMQKMITAGVVPSSKAIPLLLKGIETGTNGAAGATTKFGGLMAAQSNTLTGIWSNFVDTANMRLGQLIAPAMPAIKTSLQFLTNTMSGNGPLGQVLNDVRQKFGQAFRSALPAITQAASNIGAVLLPALQSFTGYVTGTVGPFLSRVFSGIASVLKTYAPLFKDIGRWVATAVFPVLADVGRLFTTQIVPIVEKFFKAALPGFRDLFGALKSVWGSIVILWNALKPVIAPAVTVALGAILLAFRTIAWALNNVVAPAIRLVANAISGIIGAFKTVINWFRTVPGLISSAIGNVANLLYDKGKQVIQGLWNGLKWLWDHGPFGWLKSLAGIISKIKGPISLDAKLLFPHGKAIMQSFLNGLTKGWGAVTGFLGGVAGKVGGFFGNMFGADSGVGQWKNLVDQILGMFGLSKSWDTTVLRRMSQESGGNPYAVNNWDVNAKNGTPSKGLMQVIQPTFDAFAGPFRGWGIMNPFANIYAAIGYTLSRYGSLAALNRPGGYALGTNSATRGFHIVGERGPEVVDFSGGERVIPNNRLGGTVVNNYITVQVHGHALASKQEIGRTVADALGDFGKRGGRVPYVKA